MLEDAALYGLIPYITQMEIELFHWEGVGVSYFCLCRQAWSSQERFGNRLPELSSSTEASIIPGSRVTWFFQRLWVRTMMRGSTAKNSKAAYPRSANVTPGQPRFPTTTSRRSTKSLIITELADTNGGGERPNSLGLVPRTRRAQGKEME